MQATLVIVLHKVLSPPRFLPLLSSPIPRPCHTLLICPLPQFPFLWSPICSSIFLLFPPPLPPLFSHFLFTFYFSCPPLSFPISLTFLLHFASPLPLLSFFLFFSIHFFLSLPSPSYFLPVRAPPSLPLTTRWDLLCVHLRGVDLQLDSEKTEESGCGVRAQRWVQTMSLRNRSLGPWRWTSFGHHILNCHRPFHPSWSQLTFLAESPSVPPPVYPIP